MLKNSNKSMMAIGYVGVIFLIGSCLGTIYILELKQEQRNLQSIPKELEINSWDDYYNYMNKTFVVGMSREEMYEELEKFGDYRITPPIPPHTSETGTYCEIVGFPIGQPVNFHRQEYLACFTSDDDILVRWTYYN